MNRRTALLAAIACCAAAGSVYALYEVIDHGEWPKSWPAELEPIRKQARTLVGPQIANRHYQISFTKREEFEAAWPHFLKVKTKGAPIILVRGPKTDFFAIKPAGLLIHSPPTDDKGTDPVEQIPSQDNPRLTWMKATFFELVVDGEIVDLNRIPLPEDTPIIDERFKGKNDKAPARKTK
jgi:hypothetical protein